MCVKTCTNGEKAVTKSASLMLISPMLRLEMYFCAEALRDAGVFVAADNVVCGNCLRVAQLADKQ